jgi:uncharacterized protein YigA (DUF484 family)
MSTLKQPAAAAESTESSIVAYLQAHPDFFDRHPGVLQGLRLTHRTSGAAVSLVERQVTVLRDKNLKLERQLKDLVDVARTNDAIATRIHRLATRLLAAADRSAVIDTLEEELRLSFAADAAVLVLFGTGTRALETVFLRVVGRDDLAIGPFRTFIEAGTPRCGQVRDSQRDFLFGAGNASVGSVALIPLGPGCEVGFLAIGSRDADHFHPGKSIDFLVRIGELVSSALG